MMSFASIISPVQFLPVIDSVEGTHICISTWPFSWGPPLFVNTSLLFLTLHALLAMNDEYRHD